MRSTLTILTRLLRIRPQAPTRPLGWAWQEAEHLRVQREAAQAIRAHQERLWGD